jgi:hypothetical protein
MPGSVAIGTPCRARARDVILPRRLHASCGPQHYVYGTLLDIIIIIIIIIVIIIIIIIIIIISFNHIMAVT